MTQKEEATPATGAAKNTQTIITADDSSADAVNFDSQLYKRAKTKPTPMRDEAYCGLIGEAVEIAIPETEACPEALLCQMLVAIGNIIGRGPYFNQGDYHRAVTNVVLVGDTSAGRKGTSMRVVRSLLEEIDPEWNVSRVKKGIQTGEALITLIRDDKVKVDKKGEEYVIEGVDDKRMLILEEEFARLLGVGQRKGNPLNAVIREVFDSPRRLESQSKIDPETATDPHVSLIAHVTPIELLALLNKVDVGNGFINRLMFIESRETQRLPFAKVPNWQEHLDLVRNLREAIQFARQVNEVTWRADGAKAWCHWYNHRIIPGGSIGSILGRAEAHILRIALIFALLDCREQVTEAHFNAALAIWDYAAQTARRVFGNTTGDKLADKIFAYVQRHGEVTRWQLSAEALAGNTPKIDLDLALSLLVENNMMRVRTEKRDGDKPTEIISVISGNN